MKPADNKRAGIKGSVLKNPVGLLLVGLGVAWNCQLALSVHHQVLFQFFSLLAKLNDFWLTVKNEGKQRPRAVPEDFVHLYVKVFK